MQFSVIPGILVIVLHLKNYFLVKIWNEKKKLKEKDYFFLFLSLIVFYFKVDWRQFFLCSKS